MSNLTLTLSPKTEATIHTLKTYFDAPSKADVVRRALILLELLKEAEENKASLVFKKGNVETRVIIR